MRHRFLAAVIASGMALGWGATAGTAELIGFQPNDTGINASDGKAGHPTAPAMSGVPLPASLLLFLGALGGLALVTRGRRSREEPATGSTGCAPVQAPVPSVPERQSANSGARVFHLPVPVRSADRRKPAVSVLCSGHTVAYTHPPARCSDRANACKEEAM